MMTRRRTKAGGSTTASNAPDNSQDTDAGSEVSSTKPGSSVNKPFTVPIPDDLDIEYLSSTLPDVDFSRPSAEDVLALYQLVLGQAAEFDATQRELEEAHAEIEKKDVELDQILQDRETMSVVSQRELEKVQDELKQIKQERDELASEKIELRKQLMMVTTSQTSSSSEVEFLKNRINDTEREKRDLVGVVDRLKEDSAMRDEEVTSLRANLKQARQEYQSLESQLREVRSTETSTRFKLDSLTQQLQLAKDECERLTNTLTTQQSTHTAYRTSTSTQLTTLQSQLSTLQTEHTAVQSSLSSLRSSHAQLSTDNSRLSREKEEYKRRQVESEEEFGREVEGLKRLVAVMERREEEAKGVVRRIESDWESVQRTAERREDELLREVERERKRVEELEMKLEEFERVLERVNRGEYPVPSTEAAMGLGVSPSMGSVFGTPGTPATPMRSGISDATEMAIMGLSPTIAMASRAQKAGKTFTEVYADHVRLQDAYARKCREYENMEKALNGVLNQIEERAPVLAEQRMEYDRLVSESHHISSELSAALEARDAHAKAALDATKKLNSTLKENNMLVKQADDLGRQVRYLLRQKERLDHPELPDEEDTEMIDGESGAQSDNIEDVITNNLVLFTTLPGMQIQNQKLLRIVRELGAKMESEEKEWKEDFAKKWEVETREKDAAVQEAAKAMETMQETIEREKAAKEVAIKEKDTLRAMLERMKKEGGPSAVRGGESNGASTVGQNGVRAGEEPEGLKSQLVEVQNEFEAYRTEMDVDGGRVREELVRVQRENGQLNGALAKATARIEHMNERHQMMKEQYSVQARDMDELRKRYDIVCDKWTRTDVEFARATEELSVLEGKMEIMRNECANLRAEKGIWDSIQSRLVEENRALSVERSHLSDLMSNVQKMHNDLERSGENDRKRLENQIQMLEGQTLDIRNQLNLERDSVQRLTLQRELEAKELQSRLDKQTQELSTTRESLARAETSKTHLEEKVSDLSRQLQGNEEKLAVYERRGPIASSSAMAVDGVAQVDDGTTKEQQLETEVADLRASLKVMELDLENARKHVAQFQEISQASEAALASLSSTHEEYKASTEAALAKQASEYAALQANLEAVKQQLEESKKMLADAKRVADEEREAWRDDKKTLEDTIVDLTSSEKHIAEDRSSRDSEIREQEERAKAAEERYSREVIAHAESIQTIEQLRAQLNQLQTSSRQNAAAAETAAAKLTASEASWTQQREALDKEIADLSARAKELTEQNKVLHEHLDSVSSQAARIRETAATDPASASAENVDTGDSELHRVIAYLRREKEIVDMQLELSKQENTRLKSQIARLTQDLDDTRTTLSEERERAVAAAATDAQHAELVEKINQLTILRESNATLRADSEAHSKRVRQLDIKVRTMTAELEPLREQARVAKAELEARNLHVRKLEEENKKWQERNAQLLTKYDRIDPAEMQALKDELQRLKAEKAAASATDSADEAAKAERLEALEKNLKSHKDALAQFRQRMGQVNGEKAQLNRDLSAAREQLKALNAQLEAQKNATPAQDAGSQQLRTELARLRMEKANVDRQLAEEKAKQTNAQPAANVTALQAQITSLTTERDRLKTEMAALSSAPASKDNNAQWEAEKAALVKSHAEAVAKAEAETKKLQEEVRGFKMSNDKFKARIEDSNKARQKLVDEQAAALKAAVDKATEAASGTNSEEIIKKHAEELQALEARLKTQYEAELKAAVSAVEAKVKEESTTSAAVPPDTESAVKEAVAKREKEIMATVDERIAKAQEAGRLEIQAKMKVKDGLLVRVQTKIKQLEAQIDAWKKAGLVPEDDTPVAASNPPTTSNATPATAAPSAPVSATSTTPTTTQAPTAPVTRGGARGGLAGRGTSLPRRPSVPAAGPSNVGLGRGRGGMSIRGTANPAAAVNAAAAANAGLSITGAAAKRAREENEAASGNSLAKRLKPAEGGAAQNAGGNAGAPAGGPKPPVQLQRNRTGHP